MLTVKGIDQYTYDELKSMIDSRVKAIIDENELDVTFIDSALYGSRIYGKPRKNSDLDYVFEYSGDFAEDALFDIMNDPVMRIDGIKIDVNPITKYKSGTLDSYIKKAASYKKVNEGFCNVCDDGPIEIELDTDVDPRLSDSPTEEVWVCDASKEFPKMIEFECTCQSNGTKVYFDISKESLQKCYEEDGDWDRLLGKHILWSNKLNINESLDLSFNLKKNGKTNDVEFDNSDVETQEIKERKVEFMINVIDCILDGSVTDEQIDKFEKYLGMFDEPFYKFPADQSFSTFILNMLHAFGVKCNLNWIDTSEVTSMYELFANIIFEGDISKWDVSNVTDMHGMFKKSSFNGDISKWDVSNVTDMQSMFYQADFNSDISEWKTGNVTNMCTMFARSKFNNDISNWDVSNVTDIRFVFTKCPIKEEFKPKALQKLSESISNFNLRRENSVSDVDFNNDEVKAADIKAQRKDFMLKIIDAMLDQSVTDEQIQQFNDHLKYFTEPFYKVKENYEFEMLVYLIHNNVGDHCDLNWIDTSAVTAMDGLFKNISFDGDISKWDVSNVTDMHEMFFMSNFNGDISKWNVGKVTDMNSMFYKSEFTGDISKWNVSNVTNMGSMFAYSEFNGDISNWDTCSLTDMPDMFAHSKFTGDISNWDVSKVTEFGSAFAWSQFNGNISSWNVSNARNLAWMFAFSKFRQDISDWNLPSNIGASDIDKMFYDCSIKKEFKPKALQNISESISNFNLRRDNRTGVDFDNDEVSAEQISHTQLKFRLKKIAGKILNQTITEDETACFKEHCAEFDLLYTVYSNKELKELIKWCIEKIGEQCNLNWIDVSNVNDMSYMFANSNFDGDISNWDVSGVCNMERMFEFSKFNRDISKWDVSSVTNMKNMFSLSVFNGDISKWDVSNVVDMAFMFFDSKFNKPIDTWNVSNVRNLARMFAFSKFNQDISDWNLDISNTDKMFDNCSIKKEFKPKALQNISESISNFNLRRDDRSVDFDNDEVGAEQIKHTQTKYRLRQIVKHILGGLPSDEEADFFEEHFDEFKNETLYVVKPDEDIHEILKWINNNSIMDITELNWLDVSQVTDMHDLFSYRSKPLDISLWDVHNVTNMESMFYESKFNGDISGWDVSSVKNMKAMFAESEFNGDINRWDVSNVKDMTSMFEGSKFNGDISKWDVSNVQDSDYIFRSCQIKEKYKPKAWQLDISESVSNFNLRRDSRTDVDFDDDEVDASDVKEYKKDFILKFINAMLDGTINDEETQKLNSYLSLIKDPIYKVNTINELTDAIHMTVQCLGPQCNLNWIDISAITNMSYAFHDTEFDGDISRWDVSNVEDMSNMFSYSKFNGDISRWDVSHVERMTNMFTRSKFNQDLSKWDVSSVKNMGCMFDNSKFTGNISQWDVSNVTNMYGMFANSKFNGDISAWDISKVENMSSMFERSQFDQDLSNWRLKDQTNVQQMFKDSPMMDKHEHKPCKHITEAVSSFNLRRDNRTDIDFDDDNVDAEQVKYSQTKYRLRQIAQQIVDKTLRSTKNINFFKEHYIEYIDKPFYRVNSTNDLKTLIKWCLKNIDLHCNLNWIDVSAITDMSYLFAEGARKREKIYATFNGDISEWNVHNVKDMSYMFYKSEFNGDISKWDVNNVSDMSSAFRESKFTGDISNWDVNNVRSMHNMFCLTEFNGDISEWNVHNVKDMSFMFYYAKFTGDLSEWDVHNVTNMAGVFEGTAFNKDISKWDVHNVRFMSSMFEESKFNQDISMWDVSNVQDSAFIFLGCQIKEKYKPKAWQLDISESVSNFNLRKDNRTDIDFDDDTVSTEQINKSNIKWKLHKIIEKSLEQQLSNDEIEFFNEHITASDEYLYQPQTKAELKEAIRQAILQFGRKCNLNWIDTSRITDMRSLFMVSDYDDYTVTGCDTMPEFNGNISKWDVSHVRDMRWMFSSDGGKSNLFNGDISKWDVSNVRNMQGMFEGSKFNKDISKWDVSRVKDMSYMFQHTSFNKDISGWDVSNVTDMQSMFAQCLKFNQDISKWDVRHVTDMDYMFAGDMPQVGAPALENYSQFNQDISGWDVSHVVHMKDMFTCSMFNQDISKWDVSSAISYANIFKYCKIEEENKPLAFQGMYYS